MSFNEKAPALLSPENQDPEWDRYRRHIEAESPVVANSLDELTEEHRRVLDLVLNRQGWGLDAFRGIDNEAEVATAIDDFGKQMSETQEHAEHKKIAEALIRQLGLE